MADEEKKPEGEAAAAAPAEGEAAPPAEEKKEEKKEEKPIKETKAQMKKRLKAEAEAQRLKDAREEEERKRSVERENQRWKDCLNCLKSSVPRLRENPWVIVLEPNFIHDYLDSLTETLANLSKHEDDLNTVRSVLQDVYECFVDIGKFAKSQPAFYIKEDSTINRFVRLLEQVAHRGSDKALFPNVLCLLGPTFDRPDLYDKLADSHVVNSLMSFARTDWMPTASTLQLLLLIFKKLSTNERMREIFVEDPGFEKLQLMSFGYTKGFTEEQQVLAKSALELFPAPERPEGMPEETDSYQN